MKRLLCIVGIMFVCGQYFDDPTGGGFMGQRPKYCKPYICKKDEEAVPKRMLRLVSKGSCNGLASGMAMMGGKQDDVLSGCCDARQACDSICGTTLKMCEDMFESCVNATCAAAVDADECSKSGNLFKMIASLGDGCQKFEPGQNSACECLPSGEKANRRRFQILNDIYKKYSPEDMNKVQPLADKANTSKKFASLLAKLVSKFPAMIKIQADPQQAYFDELMKKSKSESASGSGSDKKKSSDNNEEDVVLSLDDEEAAAAEEERIEL